MLTRTLGRSGLEVSGLGMGCWAIGGPYWDVNGDERSPMGWGNVDDQESIRAIHAAIDLGVTFFDTADSYGCGHSEEILGQALRDRRNGVTIATKFGSVFDAAKKEYYPQPDLEITGDFVREACEASLRRLGTDVIDVYQLHHGTYDLERLPEVVEALEGLVREGKIRAYGWSTNDVDRIRVFAEGAHCTAVQSFLSVFWDYPEVQAVCDELDLANINKQPLAMGLLTGKFNENPTFQENDFRRQEFAEQRDRINFRIRQAEALREALTTGGRTLAQGALAWIWARQERAIPIPGFKNVRQARENAAAMEFGPLPARQMSEVREILDRTEKESA